MYYNLLLTIEWYWHGIKYNVYYWYIIAILLILLLLLLLTIVFHWSIRSGIDILLFIMICIIDIGRYYMCKCVMLFFNVAIGNVCICVAIQ